VVRPGEGVRVHNARFRIEGRFRSHKKAGLSGLVEGQKVEFEMVADKRGRLSADNLRLIE
jgi:hypothetical protein